MASLLLPPSTLYTVKLLRTLLLIQWNRRLNILTKITPTRLIRSLPR